MKHIRIACLTLLAFILYALPACRREYSGNPFEDYRWIGEIRADHPRVFFNKQSFRAISERALNEEQAVFSTLRERVDDLIGQEIVFSNPLVPDGTQNADHMYGTRAAEAAFVYRVTGEEKYLELCRRILAKLTDYYLLRNENGLNIMWYAFSRINALAAYDWIFSDLTETERKEIGTPLLSSIREMVPTERGSVFRKNYGGITTGFYGPPCLPWYAGLVFYNTGINDSLSLELLKKGYEDHVALLAHRSRVAGDDGGGASAVLSYCMQAYPWAEYNFFHTFESATGLDMAGKWPYVPRFINYVFWNWLPGQLQFGYGDANHRENELPVRYLHLHLSQMIHFYGESRPEMIALAKWMRSRVEARPQDAFPWARFLLTRTHEAIEPAGPSEALPAARHFPNMGQIFMRSGSGPDDTYAIFTAGGLLTQHRHFDNNNFVIFKKGFVTLDSGTRPQPGLHLSHYYARTVAHNCITIRMPGEEMPPYWDSGPALSETDSEGYPNDGGQNDRLGSEVIAFDEQSDYVYIAGDATESYHPDKAGLVLRQFVFLPPGHFVILDRVNATSADYPKRWLLHTANEPVVDGREFRADHRGGRLYCRTLWPLDAELTKIGGPGKQFWSDGRNWALPELKPGEWNYHRMQWLDNSHPLFGQWRMEITPGKARANDLFLHLLQVGDTTLQSMSPAKLITEKEAIGVAFTQGDQNYNVMFTTAGRPGGRITIRRNGRPLLEETFTSEVKEQEGLY